MGRSRYKIYNKRQPHFLTMTVVQWLPLFGNPEATQIILDSLQFLIAVIAMDLRQPKFGKTLRAIANDSELARLSRINSDRYALSAFAAGSFLAAVAAIMNSFDTEQIAFHIQKYIFVYKSIQ